MTRREEIITATLGCRQNYVDLKRPITPDDVADAFEKGAYWADKTMIDKTCDWMKEQVYQEYGGGPLERLIPDTRIEEFRKAMEE